MYPLLEMISFSVSHSLSSDELSIEDVRSPRTTAKAEQRFVQPAPPHKQFGSREFIPGLVKSPRLANQPDAPSTRSPDKHNHGDSSPQYKNGEALLQQLFVPLQAQRSPLPPRIRFDSGNSTDERKNIKFLEPPPRHKRIKKKKKKTTGGLF